jgi:hypothetical protein
VIEISNGDKHLQGAEVVVLRKLDPPYILKAVESQQSNEEGLASIRGLPPGQYRVLVRHTGITGEQANVTVISGVAAEQARVKLSWPLERTLRTQQVLGTFYAGRDQAPLFGATLSLSQVFPDGLALRVKTNMEGQFVFPSVPQGIYVLNIAERKDGSAANGVDGNVFVEVSHDAENHIPALLLTHTSCGLGYQPAKEKTR